MTVGPPSPGDPGASLPGDAALRRLLELAADGEGDDDGEADAAPPLPPRYRVLREIGRGGMGIVYEAFDEQLGRACALKTLPSGSASVELRRRFAREALAAARLRHPHVAAVYDATPDYISMQLVAGAPIDAVPRSERRLCVELVRDAARAVHHAHEQGIVHRDLKPSNLLVEGRHVYVVDFGLARQLGLPDGRDAMQSLPGAVLGTPAFMPPEQAQGAPTDARSDVYALGATLHCCLCGAPPLQAPDLPALLRAIVETEAPPMRVDPDLDRVVRKCLAKDPAQRYATAQDLADDLDRWLRHEPVVARPPSLAYRVRKFVQRQRRALRTAAVAGLVTAAVLVPVALRENAARTAADEAVQLADHAAAVLQDATMYRRLGDEDSARQVLDAAAARVRAFLDRREVPRVRYLLGRLLRAQGRTDDAIAELERAIAADGSLREARFLRGLLLAAALDPSPEQRRVAVADLQQPLADVAAVTGVDRLFGRAELARLQGRHEDAAAMLAEVIEYDPMHVGARWSGLLAARELGRGDLVTFYSASLSDLLSSYGPVYLARHRWQLPTSILGLDAALVDLTAELADGTADVPLAKAHSALARLRRALRLESEGDDAGALEALLRAVDDHDMAARGRELGGARNNNGVCLLQLARLRARRGDAAAAASARSRAEAELQRASELEPTLPAPHYNRGMLCLQLVDLGVRLGDVALVRQRGRQAQAEFAAALERAGDGWPLARRCREHADAAAGACERVR